MTIRMTVLGLASYACLSVGLAADALRLDFSTPPLLRILGRQEEQKLIVPRCDVSPTVDGKLAEAAWRSALEMPRFSESGPRTRALLCFDDRALYVAMQCDEKPGREPVGGPGPRDFRPWSDDVVDIWIDTNREDNESCRFIVNHAGAIHDTVMRGAGRYPEYNPEWSHAVSRAPGMWTVEACIPWAALKQDRLPGSLGFNIGRAMPGLGDVAWRDPVSDTVNGVLVLGNSASEREPAPAQAPAGAPEGATSALTVRVGSSALRAGERWLRADLRVLPQKAPLHRVRVRASLFGLGKGDPLEQLTATPTRGEGRLYVDLRRHGLKQARVVVEMLEDGALADVAEFIVEAEPGPSPLAPGQRIPIEVDWPAGGDALTSWPVTVCVPFARGALWDAANVRLVDGKGFAQRQQREVLGRWGPDGAIKWLRFDAVVSRGEEYFIEATPAGRRPAAGPAVSVREEAGRVLVGAGGVEYVLGVGASPIHEMRMDGQIVARSAGARGLYLIDQKGRLACASADGETMRVEAAGPNAACVRFEGDYRTADGEALARHITRVEVSLKSFVRMTHTLVLTRDTNEIWFRDIGWEFAVAPGADAKALFAASREDWREALAAPVPAGDGAIMVQDSHYSLGHGENHFEIVAGGKRIAEGEECGDWGAVSGAAAGLLIGCRDAARQHPKDLEIRGDRVCLRLYSPRGGAELDFRIPALISRWDLEGWYKRARKSADKIPWLLEKVRAYDSNAIGWAKTHELYMMPFPPGAKTDTLVASARLLSKPVYALPAPDWTCSTGVLGRIHPRDPERFPIMEKVLDVSLKREPEIMEKWGDFGFVDYYAGPHYSTGAPQRYLASYELRGAFWLSYARSGARGVREWCEKIDRTYMDRAFASWDGPGRVKGLHLYSPSDGWHGYGKSCLPFYWEGTSFLTSHGYTCLDNLVSMHFLTGCRRARDVVEEYAEGVKRYWTPARARSAWRQIVLFRMLTEAYLLLWDPEIGAMAEATADTFADPEGAIGLTKNRPYRSTTYKLHGDIPALILGWEVTGAPRCRELAVQAAHHFWRVYLGLPPFNHTSTTGVANSFLHTETGDPVYAQTMALRIRRGLAKLLDPETGEVGGLGRTSQFDLFNGWPWAMGLLARTDADRRRQTSWAAFEDFGFPVSVVVHKPEIEAVKVSVRRLDSPHDLGPGDTGGARVRAIALSRGLGQGLNQVRELSMGFTDVEIPKDSAEGAYEVMPGVGDGWLVLTHSDAKLVVYAPRYWKPALDFAPPVRWYFELPKDAPGAGIFFEGSARLFDPGGQPAFGAEAQHGWVDLPAEQPGLWSFEPVVNQLVRVRNLPPFFAADSPASHFTPEIPWERERVESEQEQEEEESRTAPPSLYVAGVTGGPADKALMLTGERVFKLQAGAAHPGGDGGLFLPHREGTIEFFMKPRWSTFDLPAKVKKPLLTVNTNARPWNLWYTKNPAPTMAYHPTHCLFSRFYYEWPSRWMFTYPQTRAVVEPHRWTHVAWVWGVRKVASARGKETFLASQLFFDGRAGKPHLIRNADKPGDVPGLLLLTGQLDAALDELRISDVQRYTESFAPAAAAEFEVDEHTRALFHFNGQALGRSCGTGASLPVELVE